MASDWVYCHLETGSLLLHVNLLHAPLTSKLWRVSHKIRRAETRMLKIWDGAAVQFTAVQLAACITLFIAHLLTVSAQDYNEVVETIQRLRIWDKVRRDTAFA